MSTPGRILEIQGADGRAQQTESIFIQGDDLYLGNRTGKLVHYNLASQAKEEFVIFTRLGQANRVLDIRQVPDVGLALATDCGLFIFNEGRSYPVTNVPIKGLSPAGLEGLLLASQRGVFLLPPSILKQEPGQEKVYEVSDLQAYCISPNRSYAAFRDAQGRYWFDDIVEGLVSIHQTDTIYWASRSAIFKSRINAIAQLPNGLMVFSTEGEGLALIRGNELWSIDTEQGMPSNTCKGMVVDEHTIWVGTNRGLVKIQNIEFGKRAMNLSVLRKTDGLISEDINALAVRDDELLIGTYKGLMVIKKQVFLSDTYRPKVYITAAFAGDKPLVRLDQPVNLRYNENFVEISFVGISFKSEGKLRYRYKLEGYDETWISTANVETRYSNLDPGEYVFKVYALSQSGGESPYPAEFRFVVKPHFTQTNVFRFIAIFGIITTIAFLGYSLNTLRQKKLLTKLVQEKTKALNERLQELAELNHKLERSNSELQQFAHVASHDLKSPLRNVASFIQLLDRRLKDRLLPVEKEYIQYAVNGAKDMEQIINDLLAMSKVDQMDADKELINSEELVREILRDLQADIQEKNAKIELSRLLPSIVYSRTNAKQVFQNLITNGLKYQPPNSEPLLSIGAVASGHGWTFFVQDNGIGIESKYQEKVFELFQRLHTREEYAGTGIGLAICKKIIEKNGGKIWFESVPERGTTFYFTIQNQRETNKP